MFFHKKKKPSYQTGKVMLGLAASTTVGGWIIKSLKDKEIKRHKTQAQQTDEKLSNMQDTIARMEAKLDGLYVASNEDPNDQVEASSGHDDSADQK